MAKDKPMPKESSRREASPSHQDSLHRFQEEQREIAFSVFLPHYAERPGSVRDNTLEALEAAKVAIETADEYFATEPETKGGK